MTSTPYHVGLNDNTRSSSRVLRPPGGGHTDIFGGEPEPTRGRRPAPSVLAAAAAATAGQGDEPAKPTNGTADVPSQNGADSPQEHRTVPDFVPEPSVPDSKPNTPVESSIKTDLPKTEPKLDAPKRVRVPPGGFSSGLW